MRAPPPRGYLLLLLLAHAPTDDAYANVMHYANRRRHRPAPAGCMSQPERWGSLVVAFNCMTAQSGGIAWRRGYSPRLISSFLLLPLLSHHRLRQRQHQHKHKHHHHHHRLRSSFSHAPLAPSPPQSCRPRPWVSGPGSTPSIPSATYRVSSIHDPYCSLSFLTSPKFEHHGYRSKLLSHNLPLAPGGIHVVGIDANHRLFLPDASAALFVPSQALSGRRRRKKRPLRSPSFKPSRPRRSATGEKIVMQHAACRPAPSKHIIPRISGH